jgi:hypothetical protein
VDDGVFTPGTPEVEIDRQDGLPLAIEGERGKMGSLTLTNDRILFVDEKFGSQTGNLVGDLVGAALQSRHEEKSGGPREIVRLAEVRGARRQRRRMLLDLYELTLADGTTCRVHRKLLKKWDPTIRRLVAERHGLAVADAAPDGWRSEPR